MREDLEMLLERIESESEKWGEAARDNDASDRFIGRCLTREHDYQVFAGEIRDILRKHQV